MRYLSSQLEGNSGRSQKRQLSLTCGGNSPACETDPLSKRLQKHLLSRQHYHLPPDPSMSTMWGNNSRSEKQQLSSICRETGPESVTDPTNGKDTSYSHICLPVRHSHSTSSSQPSSVQLWSQSPCRHASSFCAGSPPRRLYGTLRVFSPRHCESHFRGTQRTDITCQFLVYHAVPCVPHRLQQIFDDGAIDQSSAKTAQRWSYIPRRQTGSSLTR